VGWEGLSVKFLEKLKRTSEEKDSRIVLALDHSVQVREQKDRLRILNNARFILREVADFIAALKVNYQLLLPLGLFDLLQLVIEDAEEHGLVTIMDCKLNDVEHTNKWAARHFFDGGFDAVIVNPFVGWEGALEGVFDEAQKRGRGVILLVYMSHLGAKEGYGRMVIVNEKEAVPQYFLFARKAVEWGADGVIVGATNPEVIERVREVLRGNQLIFSPGIGVQGGRIARVFRSGADYAIVGRMIYEARDPRKAAERIRREVNEALRRV